MNQVDFSQAGNALAPSPSIWKSCPGSTLNDQGLGFFLQEDFVGGTEVWADKAGIGGQQALVNNASAATTIPHRTGSFGGLQDLTLANVANNAIALYSQPLGQMVPNSGNQIWFEARLTKQTISDEGLFIGIAAEAIATKDLLVNGVASVAAGLSGDTLVGFTQMTDNQAKLYAVARKDAGAVVTLASDVSNFAGLAAPANLVAGTFFKIGMHFDGKRTLRIFFNGIRVASATITTASVNVADNLVFIVNEKNGAAATARTITLDWVRVAFQNRR